MTEPATLPPAPQVQFTIERASVHGWYLMHADKVIACFETAAGLAAWLERELAALEPKPNLSTGEPLPNVLANDDDPPRKRGWFGG